MFTNALKPSEHTDMAVSNKCWTNKCRKTNAIQTEVILK
jgi:hypothetical protein